jgi:SAM-dependent methyltransferase
VSTERWRDRHGESVVAALRSGDPAAVKRLYVELGELLEASYGDDVEAVPQLSLPETVPVVARLLGGVQGPVLDAGCGPLPVASMAVASAEAGRTVVALDLGAGTVRLARERAAIAGVDLLGVAGDLEALPFRDGAFAGIVCDDTIEHVPDDRRAAAELARVSAPGAAVVVATPNRRGAGVLRAKAADLLRGRRRPAAAYFAAESHLREYTWRELVALLAPVGIVDSRATVGWAGRPRRSRLVARRGLRGLDRMLVARLRAR